MERISVVGLGRLGLPLVAVLASRGFNVVGVDTSEKVLESVRNNEPLFYEPGLVELLHVFREKIEVTNDYRGVSSTDITIVLVPTPSNNGKLSIRYVLQACGEIGEVLSNKDDYHVVVISSTVNPGDCDIFIRELLETASGKKVWDDFGLCYCPEFCALGNVIEGYLHPDFVLIGESDKRAGNAVGKIFRQVVGAHSSVPFAHRSLVNAELSKLILNNYIAMKIAFANEMAELCEHIPGADVDQVTTVLGLDSRISPKYLKGATAFGGPCFLRDVVSIRSVAYDAGVFPEIMVAVGRSNTWQYDRLERIIHSIPDTVTVGVLGLAFKPGTDSVTDATGMNLLLDINTKLIAYDPLVQTEQSAASAQECVDGSDMVVITTPCPEFKGVNFHEGQTVIDCWRILNPVEVESTGANYIAIGRYRGE